MQDIHNYAIWYRFGRQPLLQRRPVKILSTNPNHYGSTTQRIDKSQIMGYRGIRYLGMTYIIDSIWNVHL